MKIKNICLKSRKVNEPYEIWVNPRISFESRVLKKYQGDDNKEYARWLVAVKSPMTYGSYDMGDSYVSEIKLGAYRLTVGEMNQHLKDNQW